MGKGTASWETIEKLLDEGYKPRVKTSKGKRYISARKGGDEKGLGQYDEVLWNKIQSWIKEDTTKIDVEKNIPQPLYTISLIPVKGIPSVEAKFFKREIEDALFEVKLERARIKGRNCKYRRVTWCVYWHFINDAKQLDKIYERFNEKIFSLPAPGNNDHSMYHINEILCFECDVYRPEKEYTKTPNE